MDWTLYYQYASFAWGLACVSFSSWVAYRFLRLRGNNHMAKALAGDKIGEAAISTCTLVFATCSLLNAASGSDTILWNSISPNLASTMRIAMFSVGAVTSAHVLYRVQKTVEDANRHGG